MELSGTITAVVIGGIVWGGFALFLSKAIIKEKQKKNGSSKS